MKKIIGAVLIGTMMIGLCSCGSTNGFDSRNEITVISREDGSGTRGAFTELFGIEKDGKDQTTKDAEVVNKTDVMLQSVAGNPYAVGYVSMGSLSDRVKAVSIDNTEPTAENIKNGSYKIARPFYLAYKQDVSEPSNDFLRFILSKEGQEVISKSYIPVLNDAAPYGGKKASGKIVVAGSSSVTPVMEKLKEAYIEINPNAEIEIQMSDSSSGIRAVIEGTCDIGMLSRELKESERSETESISIAMDGIAVIVNNNNPVESLPKETVAAVYRGEVSSWEEIK